MHVLITDCPKNLSYWDMVNIVHLETTYLVEQKIFYWKNCR